MPKPRFGQRSAFAAVTVVVALLGGLAPAGPASAAVGTPSGLAPDGGAVSTNTPTLQWNRVAGAAKYEVQTDNDPGFGSPVKATTFNSRWVPAAALPNGDNFWRVRAIGTDNSSSGWAGSSFNIGQKAGPNLKVVTPNPLPQPSNPPTLEWSVVEGASSYEVEVATEPDFLAPKKYTTSTTALVVPEQAASETYYWRVRGLLGTNIATKWSDPYGSYTIGDLANVTYTAPGQAEAVEDVVLDWEPVPGAVYYDLRVGTDPDLNTWLEEVKNIRGTRYSPDATYDNNDGWYWKVRAVNADQERIDWADVPIRQFQRQWLDKPTLLHPANVINPATGDDFYYQWTPVQHATHYELWVGDDENFSPGTFEICKTASTTYTPRSTGECTLGQGQVAFWKVRAIDAPTNVNGIFSPTFKYIYNSGPVTLVSPANGATVPVPTLKWQAQREAEKYRVSITGSGGFALVKDTYALSWTPSLDPADGPFTWTVQATDFGGGMSPKYSGRSFSIGGSPAPSGEAPLTPLTGIITDPPSARFPSLSWEPVAGAHHYRIQIGVHDSGFRFNSGTTAFLSEEFSFSAATDTGKDLMNPGQYDWEVRAYNEADAPITSWGPTGTYTIGDLDTVTGQSVALGGLALDANDECDEYLDNPGPGTHICTNVPATPVLDWDPVPGASHYMIYLAEERELTNVVYSGVTTINSRWTPNLNTNPKTLPDNDANKAYYWIIRPCKATNVCAPDPISTEAVATHAFSKISPPVELQSPANGSTVTDDEVTFIWNDYLATNQATTYAASGETSNQAARQYRIEISESNTFNTLVEQDEVDQTTFTSYSKTLPEGQLYWRVQAIDAHGNRVKYSPVWTFTKNSSPAQLISPTGGAATSGVTPFRWQPSKHALNYTLEVYANNDTTFSSGNKVYTCTTSQTACSLKSPLPASGLAYRWRVKWYDADNDVRQWSAGGSFFVNASGAPTLISPLPGAKLNGSDAYFTWSPPPGGGATYYRFERKMPSSAGVTETVTTLATAYAPLNPIADGNWEWRVVALDAAKQVLASSPWRSFVVDGTRPKVKSVKPGNGTTVKRTTNFTATFSEPVTNVTKSTVKLYLKGSSKPVKGKVTLNATKTVMKFNPTKNLKAGKKYTLKLSAAITDLSGLSLTPYKWKVTVKK